ncbi:MAG: hypothetical protein AAF432_13610 [Planctomycetota bacterium]
MAAMIVFIIRAGMSLNDTLIFAALSGIMLLLSLGHTLNMLLLLSTSFVVAPDALHFRSYRVHLTLPWASVETLTASRVGKQTPIAFDVRPDHRATFTVSRSIRTRIIDVFQFIGLVFTALITAKGHNFQYLKVRDAETLLRLNRQLIGHDIMIGEFQYRQPFDVVFAILQRYHMHHGEHVDQAIDDRHDGLGCEP